MSRVRRAALWGRWRLWQVRQNLRVTVVAFRLVVRVGLRRPTELWLGDSHAPFFNDPTWPCARLRAVGEGRYVWHLGPRLMYSLATGDLPRAPRMTCRLIGLLPGAAPMSLVCIAGEIDVRAHLAARLDRDDAVAFVGQYVDRVLSAARSAGARAVVIMPPPPSLDYRAVPPLPVRGTVAERADAFARLRTALLDDVESRRPPGRPVLVDLTSDLSGDDGLLRPEITDDGCHVNEIGRAVLRRHLGVPGHRPVTLAKVLP